MNNKGIKLLIWITVAYVPSDGILGGSFIFSPVIGFFMSEEKVMFCEWSIGHTNTPDLSWVGLGNSMVAFVCPPPFISKVLDS